MTGGMERLMTAYKQLLPRFLQDGPSEPHTLHAAFLSSPPALLMSLDVYQMLESVPKSAW